LNWHLSVDREADRVVSDPPSETASAKEPNSGLTLALSRTTSTLSQILPATSSRFADIPVGGRIEVCKEGWEIMRMIGELVEGRTADQVGTQSSEAKDASGTAGGVGLVVDYGDEKVFDNSFRVSQYVTFSKVFAMTDIVFCTAYRLSSGTRLPTSSMILEQQT
jgi:NADH dehydrogenase [ubiquinone] 1 alpha subcomplex assembly factor 7